MSRDNEDSLTDLVDDIRSVRFLFFFQIPKIKLIGHLISHSCYFGALWWLCEQVPLAPPTTPSLPPSLPPLILQVVMPQPARTPGQKKSGLSGDVARPEQSLPLAADARRPSPGRAARSQGSSQLRQEREPAITTIDVVFWIWTFARLVAELQVLIPPSSYLTLHLHRASFGCLCPSPWELQEIVPFNLEGLSNYFNQRQKWMDPAIVALVAGAVALKMHINECLDDNGVVTRSRANECDTLEARTRRLELARIAQVLPPLPPPRLCPGASAPPYGCSCPPSPPPLSPLPPPSHPPRRTCSRPPSCPSASAFSSTQSR